MAEIKFTKEQESAINTTDKTLLVSAAAGAGKTSTLTERIIRSLTREKDPDDISRMLIVTFTNAATDQLRNDIRRAIEKALNGDPENLALEKQLTLLPMAKICTIDSFCNDILRKNCDKIGMPPNYRIADRAEVEILSYSILSELINEFYENEKPEIMTSEEFVALSDTLTSSKSDSEFEKILLKLYEKSRSTIVGVEIFKQLADKYETDDCKNNEYTSYALTLLRDAAQHYENLLTKNADELINSDDKYEKAYGEAFYEDARAVKRLISGGDYFSSKKVLDEFKLKTFPSVKKEDKTPFLEEKRELHNSVSADIKKIREKYFFYTEDEMSELFRGLHKILTLLYKILAEFDRIYMQEKIRRLILEYSDIERFAFKSLYNDDNESVSDFAEAMKSEYSSVYIDEYQDVNALQAKIFDAISRENNRFMVGDIKQSIYGFRSADPDVFASMKKAFPKLGDECDSSCFSIFMSQNFRSDKCIIDFVNSVFDKAFTLTKESIGYLPDDKLVFAKGGDTEKYKKPCFLLIPENKDDTEESDAEELECRVVARKIDEILRSNKDLSPSDIAIIIRGKGKMDSYSDELSALGIASEKLDSKNFFLNSEILLALCLLNAIDNPEKDIYLAGLLASPLFSFTADELFSIRKNKKSSLYQSLISYTKENPSFKKGCEFLEKLELYRTLAEGVSIDSLVLRLYNDTGLLELARRFDGEENLYLLYNYAKNFSSSSLKGLYNFIKFINNVIENKAEFNAKRDGDKKDAVHITTIHSSKGLEYKVVFYVETHSPFKDLDAKDRIAFSEKFGISTCLRSPAGLARVENPIQNIIIHSNYKRYFEEELRVVYVALTRAKSELFIVGKVPEDAEEYLKAVKGGASALDEYSIYKTKSPLELMLMTGDDYEVFIVNGECGDVSQKLQQESAFSDLAIEKDFSDDSFDSFTVSEEELAKRFGFSYKNAHLTKIPEKLAVSVLKPEVLDGGEKEAVSELIERLSSSKKAHVIAPAFIEGSASDESAKRGIATHTFLQFFDSENLEANGAASELSRLCELKFISNANRERVRLSEIELFRESELFREMKKARKTYREFRFNTRLPAKFFTLDENLLSKIGNEELLVQGVVDCILEDEEGNLHLIDYKTDRLSKEELMNKALAAKKLNEAHARQLSYYSLAIEKIFGKAPVSLRVYSLPLGDTVEIKKISF